MAYININNLKANNPILFHPLQLQTRFIKLNIASNGGNVGNGAARVIGQVSETVKKIDSKKGGIGRFGFAPLIREHDKLLKEIKSTDQKDLNERDIWSLSKLKSDIDSMVKLVEPLVHKDCKSLRNKQLEISKLLKSISKVSKVTPNKSKKSLNKIIKKDLELEIQSLDFIFQNKTLFQNIHIPTLLSAQQSVIRYLSSIDNLLLTSLVIRNNDQQWIFNKLEKVITQIREWNNTFLEIIEMEATKCEHLTYQINGLTVHQANLQQKLIKKNKSILIWESLESLRTQLLLLEKNKADFSIVDLLRTLQLVFVEIKKLLKLFSESKRKPDYLYQELWAIFGYYKGVADLYQKNLFERNTKFENNHKSLLDLSGKLEIAIKAKRDKKYQKLTENKLEELAASFYAINTALIDLDWSTDQNESVFYEHSNEIINLYQPLLAALFSFQKLNPADLNFLLNIAGPTLKLQKTWNAKAKKLLKTQTDSLEEVYGLFKKTDRSIKAFKKKVKRNKLKQKDIQLWESLYEIRTAFDSLKLEKPIVLDEFKKDISQSKAKTTALLSQANDLTMTISTHQFIFAEIVEGGTSYIHHSTVLLQGILYQLKEKSDYTDYYIELLEQAKKIPVDNRYTASFDRVERLVDFYINRIEDWSKNINPSQLNLTIAIQNANEINGYTLHVLELIETIDKTSKSDYTRLKRSLNKCIKLLKTKQEIIRPFIIKWEEQLNVIHEKNTEFDPLFNALKIQYKGNTSIHKTIRVWGLNAKIKNLLKLIKLKSAYQVSYENDLSTLGSAYTDVVKKTASLKHMHLDLKYEIYQTNKEAKEVLLALRQLREKELENIRVLQKGLKKSISALGKISNLPKDGRVKRLEHNSKNEVMQMAFSIRNISQRNKIGPQHASVSKEIDALRYTTAAILKTYKGREKINKKDATEMEDSLLIAMQELSTRKSMLDSAEKETLSHFSSYRAKENMLNTNCSNIEDHLAPIRSRGFFDVQGPFGKGPVSNQNRFVKAGGGSEVEHENELWIRVFPDTFAIDAHDHSMPGDLQKLTHEEIEAGISYWIEAWLYNENDQENQIGAWRALCENLGAARAAWVAKVLKPLNINDRPVAITTAVPANDLTDENTKGNVFWAGLRLLAKYNETDQLTTWQNHVAACNNSLAQASKIGLKNYPLLLDRYLTLLYKNKYNLNFDLPAINKTGLDNSKFKNKLYAPLVLPVFPQVALKEQNWNAPPRSYVMPDKLVFRLYDINHGIAYNSNATNSDINVEPIPQELIVGINPENEDDADHSADGNLTLSSDINWMTDFSAALDKGMAVKIPISAKHAEEGFSKIFVMGVKDEDADSSRQLIEHLFEGHHYTEDGMSIMAPGTPTNNTIRNSSGFSTLDNPDEAFKIERQGPLFQESTDALEKTDGQILAEALGLSLDCFQNIENSDQKSRRNSQLMNASLWPATFGYFLEELLSFYDGGHFLKIPEDTNFIRDYFVENVSGRGALPVLRIQDQPYGILPVSRILYQQPNDTNPEFDWTGLNGAGDNNEQNFYKNLYLFLTGQIYNDWKNIGYWTQKTVDDPSANVEDAQKQFMKILGLHAHSVEFYNRYAIGTGDVVKDDLFQGADPVSAVGFDTTFSRLIDGYATWPTDYKKIESSTEVDYYDDWGDLILGQLRLLNKHIKLTGQKVDALKSKDDRLLKDIIPHNKNFIEWLLDAPINQIHDKSRQGEAPSNSLLYLLMRTALMNEYWSTAMNIYKTIHLADFRTRGLSMEHWNNTEDWNTTYNKAPKLPTDLDDLMTDWRAIAEKGVTIEELKSLAVGPTLSEPRLSELQSIPNIEYAYNLISMFNGDDAINDNIFEPGNVSYSSDLAGEEVIKYRIDQELNRLFYKSFVVQFNALEMADVFNLEDLTYYYSLLRQTGIFLENKGSSNGSHYDASYFALELLLPDYFTPADARLPFLFLKLHENELRGNFSGSIIMADYLKQDKGYPDYPEETKRLKELKESFDQLSTVSTAELERLMAEHLDLCSHRLDAWILGLFKKRLTLLRQKNTDSATAKNGIHLGAYAWVLDLKPGETSNNTTGDGSGAAVTDEENQGFIHAPSLNHALTAAMLRSGYEAKGGKSNSILEVNLSSRRVRRALFYFEGIRNGQSLSALLGYQLERALHDNNEYPMNGYILNLRNDYPLVSDSPGSGGAIKTNNVIDGLKFIEAFQADGNAVFTKLGVHTPSLSHLKEALDAEFIRIGNDLDAVADLAMAEGVYQVVMGNYSRSDAMMSAISEGKNPPEPEVIKTPRTGTMLTHRVGIALQAPSDGASPPDWPVKLSAKALVEPALNYWLGVQIGDPSAIRCLVRYTDADNSETEIEISVSDLKTQPLDFLMCFVSPSTDVNKELAKRLKLAALQAINLSTPLQKLDIILDETIDPNSFSIGSMIPYFNELLELISNSRHLDAIDLIHPSMDTSNLENPSGVNADELQDRLIAVYGHLTTLETNIKSVRSRLTVDFQVESLGLGTATEGPTGNLDGVKNNPLKVKSSKGRKVANSYLGLSSLIMDAAAYNLPGAIPESNVFNNNTEKRALLNKASEVLSSIAEKKKRYTAVYDETFNELPAEDKVELLLKGAAEFFGPALPVIPLFNALNPNELSNAHQPDNGFLPDKPLVMETWLTGVARVREKMNQLDNLLLFESIFQPFEAADRQLNPLQIPYRANDHWVGVELPDDYFESHEDESISLDKLSLVLKLDSSFDFQSGFGGLLVDEWTEVIPNKEETTGIAFHYDQPNARPPQNLLLAIHPESDAPDQLWKWGDIINTFKTTIDLAKIRAVEPDDLGEYKYGGQQNKFYAHSLPATLSRVIDHRVAKDFEEETGGTISDDDLEMDYDLATDFMFNNDLPLFPYSQESKIISVDPFSGKLEQVDVGKEAPVEINPGGSGKVGDIKKEDLLFPKGGGTKGEIKEKGLEDLDKTKTDKEGIKKTNGPKGKK